MRKERVDNMNILLLLVLVISFISYYATLVSYISYIFNANKFPVKNFVLSTIVYFLIWYMYIFHMPISHEPLAIFAYIALLGIQVKLIFKTNLIQTVFIAITFGVNLFAKRLAFLALIALYYNDTIFDSVINTQLTAIVAIGSFLVSISTISFSRKMISRNSLDTILADNKNLAFLTTAFSILLCILFVFSLSMGINTHNNMLTYHILFLGVFVIVAFAGFIIFAHSLAELRISTETYMRITEKNKEDIMHLEKIEEEAITDSLTGLYTRDYAIKTIDKYVADKSVFFVAFLDLDGLKNVNDDYGHEEGDFYIVTVCNIIQNFFSEHTICRYGGDEILVTGLYSKENDITRKLIKCYNEVSAIPKLYKKNYTTSLSYGVAFGHSHEKITTKEIISIADTRMYELKKANKKHRKVVSVK